MTIQYKYYLVPDMASDDRQNILPNAKFRILKLSNKHPIIPTKLKGYATRKELRKEDKQWKEYYKTDPESAQKICEDRFLLSVEHVVFTPTDNGFNKVSYKLLKHTVLGEIKDDILGIHLHSKMNPNLKTVQQIKPEDPLGIWIARIEYYCPIKKKTFTKPKTSMFPKSWDPTIFMYKIYFAWMGRRVCVSDSTVFHSKTDCGIKVDFIIKEEEIKTVYPIYTLEPFEYIET